MRLLMQQIFKSRDARKMNVIRLGFVYKNEFGSARNRQFGPTISRR